MANDVQLRALIAEEVASPAAAAIMALADAARARHGAGIVAVLFYGSCRRHADLADDQVADLYLLVDRYANVHPRRLNRLLNYVLPPNVYYLEAQVGGRTVRAKYAIVTLAQFERRVTSRALHPYFWARFAQPTSILWSIDAAVRTRLIAAFATAITTMVGATRPLLPAAAAPSELWPRAFRETYRTELRSERTDRADTLYRADQARYERVTRALDNQSELPSDAPRRAARLWRRRRVVGKTLSVLRLIKAGFTFTDGAAYLAWKIGRHAGVAIELTPWQRRHPILASGPLAWRLYRQGAIR